MRVALGPACVAALLLLSSCPTPGMSGEFACADQADCSSGLECQQGVCGAPCATACAQGQTCRAGGCVGLVAASSGNPSSSSATSGSGSNNSSNSSLASTSTSGVSSHSGTSQGTSSLVASSSSEHSSSGPASSSSLPDSSSGGTASSAASPSSASSLQPPSSSGAQSGASSSSSSAPASSGGASSSSSSCIPNACGGCTVLDKVPGRVCGACGIITCLSPETAGCVDPGANQCGGCGTLEQQPGTSCGGCKVWACASNGDLACGGPEPNACGGCDVLATPPGTACGTCGISSCSGLNQTACSQPPRSKEMTATWAQLAAQIPACDRMQDAMSLVCLAAMRRACAATNCGTPAVWGPWAVDNTGMSFTCVAGYLVNTTKAELLAASNQTCDAQSRALGCAEAAQNLCWGQHNHAIGLDMPESNGTIAVVGCLDQPVAGFQVTRNQVPPCNDINLYTPACFAGIRTYCQSLGYGAGLGPLTPGETAGTRYIGCYN